MGCHRISHLRHCFIRRLAWNYSRSKLFYSPLEIVILMLRTYAMWNKKRWVLVVFSVVAVVCSISCLNIFIKVRINTEHPSSACWSSSFPPHTSLQKQCNVSVHLLKCMICNILTNHKVVPSPRKQYGCYAIVHIKNISMLFHIMVLLSETG